MEYLSQRGYKYLYVYDDCFVSTNYDRLDQIVELFSRYDFEYHIDARYELLSTPILEKISSINFHTIKIGIQSSSLEVNEVVNRTMNISRFIQTIETLQKKNIQITLDMILGLPTESLSQFLHTLEF